MQLEKTIWGSVKIAREPSKQPEATWELAPPKISVSTPVLICHLPEKEPLQTPRIQTRGELADQIGGLLNLARIHPEGFKHMLQQQPRKEMDPIILDETSPSEEDEREISHIKKSEEEEYQTRSEDEEEEEGEYSPP